jgi:hypothetical protein
MKHVLLFEGALFATDIDGRPQGRRCDAGCDPVSDVPVTNRRVTAADVGPTRMSATEREARR